MFNCLKKKKYKRDESRIATPEIKSPAVVPGDEIVVDKELNPKVKLWYPDRAAYGGPNSFTRGTYENNYPIGATIHYSAGTNDPRNLLQYAVKQGYTFFVIDRDGNVFQNFPLNEWGYHCGKSKWPGLGDKSLNNKLVGIECISAGHLSWREDLKHTSWWGQVIPGEEVREIPRDIGNIKKGSYHKFSELQETGLTKLCMWLKKNNPEIFNLEYVLGHSEISAGRKQDPGGALSMSMVEFREKLIENYTLDRFNNN